MASDVVREGIFAINKPTGGSSAQVIRECQEAFNTSKFFQPVIEEAVAKVYAQNNQAPRQKLVTRAKSLKMGHGGTLDPIASGVLIMGIGSGTKGLQNFINCSKSYETTLVFGANTDTYDRCGKIIQKRPYDHITKEKVEEALEGFRGEQVQIPPVYSALKMDGKPLYEYAREGKPLPREIKGRTVTALKVEMLEWYPPGKHNHRWPTVEADATEKNIAEALWKAAKAQESRTSMSPEEKQEEDKALQAHENMKSKFEERQDALVRDAPQGSAKREKRNKKNKVAPMMSGALGDLPKPTYSSKGANLVPDAPDESSPPPWSDEGPPACKIRLSVTSGYYIRSFIHDLGTKLGSAALMSVLVRSEQNGFSLHDGTVLEHEDIKDEKIWAPKMEAMLKRWSERSTETNGAVETANGAVEKTEAVNGDEVKPSKEKGEEEEKAQVGQKRGRSASRSPSPGKAASKKKKRRDSSAHESEVSWNGIQD